ncbi:MAG: hypothetical protein M5U28_03790 [Sandaracinaceae bacterium]|nr:hypothetical protein [Sandaracinaceae bacterium]
MLVLIDVDEHTGALDDLLSVPAAYVGNESDERILALQGVAHLVEPDMAPVIRRSPLLDGLERVVERDSRRLRGGVVRPQRATRLQRVMEQRA